MIFKVKPGIPREQVNAEFQSFHEKFAKTAPSFVYPDPPFRTEFKSVNEGILGKFANTLLALLAAVGFLLADRLRQRRESAAGASQRPAR